MFAKAVLIAGIIFAVWITAHWDFDPFSQKAQTNGTLEETYKSAMCLPDVSMKTLKGQAIGLHDFKGRIVLVNFWASWCAPCIEEFPALVALASRYPDGLVFLAVSVDEDTEKAKTFIRKIEKMNPALSEIENIYVVWDSDKHISQDIFQTFRYPETFILDQSLCVSRKVVGAIKWEDSTIRSYIIDLFPNKYHKS